MAATQVAPPPFKEEILGIIHKLVDLPISHGLISRMKQLEHLLVHFEAREFSYYDHRGIHIACFYASWFVFIGASNMHLFSLIFFFLQMS